MNKIYSRALIPRGIMSDVKIFMLLFSISLIISACNDKCMVRLDLQGLTISGDRKRFKIFNTCAKTLVIEGFTTSCECTILNLKKGERIAPGDSLNINLNVQRKSLYSDNLVYVTIKTNATPALLSFSFKP